MTKRTLAATMLAAGLAGSMLRPALADGAASTRNLILGGAAAAAGTLLIINHNKQVHQRYADDARRQADTQAGANNAQAAYASERRAYDSEVAVNAEFKREVATQHRLIVSLRRQVALQDSRPRSVVAIAQPRSVVPVAAAGPAVVRAARAVPAAQRGARVATSLGWGQL